MTRLQRHGLTRTLKVLVTAFVVLVVILAACTPGIPLHVRGRLVGGAAALQILFTLYVSLGRLQRYILAETFRALVPAFAALMLIMVVGLCMQLLHEGLDVVRLRGLLVPIFAYCVPMVLPSAFLTAVIMNFGRLAADNEVIALRAAGIHLLRVVYPVLGAGALLTLLAVYFQFELNPRAHATINSLKYDAFRQVLLDKVALSAKRELFFKGDPSYHLLYDDFVNGRMTNLLVIEVEPWSQRPRTIITAASASVQADPSVEGSIQFDMKDCVITTFGLRQYGEASPPTVAEEALLSPSLGRQGTDLTDDDKYMPTVPLLHKLWDLRADIAGQEADLQRRGLLPPPAKRRDPGSIRKEQRAIIRSIALELDQVSKQIAPLQEDVKKYGEREPARLNQLIAEDRERLEQTRTELKGLKDQQAALLQEISRMRSLDSGLVDYTRLVELQNQQKAVQSGIESHEPEIDKRAKEIAEAQEQLNQDLEKAARVREQAAVLEEHKEKLREDRRQPESLARWADDQDDLNSLRIRIHKRLVQAASVFLFALIGMPLGIMAGGRSVMVAFGLSFAIVLAGFYPFVIFGQVAAEAGMLPIVPAMWAGNVFVFIIGAALTAKVLRG